MRLTFGDRYPLFVLTYPGSPRLASLSERTNFDFLDIRVCPGAVTLPPFLGLFENIRNIIAGHDDQPFILFAEDDVLFTPQFNRKALQEVIDSGKALGADIILGGIKEGTRLCLTDAATLLRIENYRGSQLMIVFKKCYTKIIDAPVDREFELFCSFNTGLKKMVTYPFFAYQINSVSRFLPTTGHLEDYRSFERQVPALIQERSHFNRPDSTF